MQQESATQAAIAVHNLVKSYRVVQKTKEGLWSAIRSLWQREYKMVEAVKGISLTIAPGEMVAFLGPNGAGKTTTLKMLSGLIYPTAGTAQVLGFVPWERQNAYRRRFALVMGQKNQLWWDLPANESFRLHREIYQIPQANYRQLLGELLDMLHLNDLVSRPVRELSLGERMKLELVAALLHSPQVLFLDEPTIGLDVIAQQQLRQFLKEYNQRFQTTVVLTSHYMKDVESLCQRAIVINHGLIVYDGRLEGLINRYSTAKVLKIHFGDEQALPDLSRFGEVVSQAGPLLTLRVERERIASTLSSVLEQYVVLDVTVEEVPLDDVIAKLFLQTSEPEPATV